MKEKKTLLVAFSTQKGGAGKSALTVLMAGHFHYVKGYNVGVIDCDFPQFSIYNMRDRDRKTVTNIDHYKLMAFNQLKTLNKKPYPILKSSPVDAVTAAEKMIRESPEYLDIIFFDLPGTLNSEGIIKTLSMIDFIITPVTADRMVLQSSLEFASLLNDNVISTGKSNIQGLYLIWNQVDSRERTGLYDTFNTLFGELGLHVLKTMIPDRKRFRHELTEEVRPVFRSTLFPVDKQLIRDTNLDLLADEIEELISLKAYGEER